MKVSSVILLALLAFATVTSVARADAVEEFEIEDDAEEVEDRAVLLVHRLISPKTPNEGAEFTVTIDVRNAGTSEATDVTIEDGDWPLDQFSVSGATTAQHPSVPAGSTVRLQYRVTSKVAGVHQQRPVLVRYLPTEDDATPQTTASPWLLVRTRTGLEAAKARLVNFGAAVTGGTVATEEAWIRLAAILGAATLAVVAYKAYASVREASRASSRASALKALGVDKDE